MFLPEGNLFLNNQFNVRSLAFSEVIKYNRKHFVNLASGMVREFQSDGFNKWIRP
jgi:(S)-2-hydroxyglutarate dehydrogenase